MRRLAVLSLGLVLLSACGHDFGSPDSGRPHGPRGMNGDPSGRAAGIRRLLSYDANKDGTITRAEMEAGLRADFAKLDTDHSGTLTADEVRAENARRYQADGPQYSPILDWNQDGVIEFGEFASTTRSLFEELDANQDGELSPSELKPPHGPTLEEPARRPLRN